MVKKLEIDYNEKGEIISPTYVEMASKAVATLDGKA